METIDYIKLIVATIKHLSKNDLDFILSIALQLKEEKG